MASGPRLKYSVFPPILTAASLIALALPAGFVLKPVLAAAALFGIAACHGARLFPRESAAWRLLFGAVSASVFLILTGALAFYAWDLGFGAAAIAFTVTGLAPLALPAWHPRPPIAQQEPASAAPVTMGPRKMRHLLLGLALLAAHLVVITAAIAAARAGATDVALRTPWDAVSPGYFALLSVAALGVSVLVATGLVRRTALPALILLWFACTSVAAYAYAIGFGFDPFIHQATERLIAATGTVSPKPFYYVGHYAYVVLLSRLTGLPVGALDTWLVPAGSAVLLPVLFWTLRRSLSWDTPLALTATLGLFALPLAPFTHTTPQGFADVILILASCLAFAALVAEAVPLAYAAVLALATAAVHPLAGIPVLAFVVVAAATRMIQGMSRRALAWRRAALIALTALGAIALPTVFILHSLFSDATVGLDADSIRAPVTLLRELRTTPEIASRQFDAALDLAYAWRLWRIPLLLLLAAAGIRFLRRYGDAAAVYGASAIIFLGNYVFLKSFLTFPFLIDYEQHAYADRLLDLTVYLLAPVMLAALGAAAARMRNGAPSVRIGLVLLLAMLIVLSTYLAYPRRDRYESSRGWSTSATDVAAVRAIQEDAADEPYVVLANQTVSAAAIREYGFARYYPGDIFYYPVPTGGPLYAEFLAMNACFGCRETAERAMDLAGVDRAYYVVNHYWWDANAIVSNARAVAADQMIFDDLVWVFRYER